MESKVTIITPTFKRSHILGNTIKSILEQSYKHFEYIILDDNNLGDVEEIRKTRQLVESFGDSRLRYLKNTTNLGHPNIFGKCLDLIKGDFFMLYGDDDELLPDSLSIFVNYLNSNPDVSVVHGMDMFRDESGNISKLESPIEKDTIFDSTVYLESLLNIDGKYGISLSACLFRSEIISTNRIKVYGSYQWDVYFFAQYFLFSKKIGFLNLYTDIRNAAVHHTGKDQSDLYLFYINVENLFLIEKFLNEFPFALSVRKISINKYRFRVGKKLLFQFMHLKDFNRAIFCLELGVKNIIRVLLSHLCWLIIKPIAIVSGKVLALKFKLFGKKL